MTGKSQRINLSIALSLIIIGVALRILPHPANFAPIAAVAVFGGAVLPRKLAVWTPVTAMVVSDMVIGTHNLVLVTWGCYALIALASGRWLKKPTFAKGAGLTMGSSLFFFFVTNFAVWVCSGMYDRTYAGLIQCFTMAAPFFRNTALSDLIFTGSLFGMYYLAQHIVAGTERSRPADAVET